VTADGRTTITTATASANTSALIVDQNGTGNILSASSSGINKFLINNSGMITTIDGVAHTIDDVTGNLTLTSNSNTISLNDNVTFAGTTTLNGQTYTWPASGGSNTYVLQTNGSGTLSWVAQTGGGVSFWDQANGTLYPLNSTVDFLLGGQATTSAKFAVLNMNAGTPTATIAGTTSNAALFFDGNGNLSTANRQSLVLGNSATYNSTGNILLNPNGTGSVGIGTTNPLQALHVSGHCITGDAILPIRRRKKNKNSDDNDDEDDDNWEEILERLDQVKPGDEVLSLNEMTGTMEYSKINQVLDMGIKEVYEITTKSGKTIRTTSEHPYLTDTRLQS
jgi:hypothetical protein